MGIKLATNWFDKGLVRVLGKRGVYVVSIRSITEIDPEDFDLVYYARVVPPLLDKSVITSRKLRNVIYGLHSPLNIEYSVRPSHYLYNLVIPPQIYALFTRGITLHTLNLDDYRSLGMFYSKVVYMPLGVDTELFRCSISKADTFTVIYASRPSWHKGTDLLVNIIIPMILKVLGHEVKIVITDATSGHLSYLYDRIKGISQIELYGYLPIEKFVKLLSKAHILLFPSRYESFGRVVLDALACGVIPVAFNVRGFVRDVILKTKLSYYVVDYPSLTAFIIKILELYKLWTQSPDKFSTLSTYACNIAKQYNWDNVGALWATVFKRTASEHLLNVTSS